MSDPVTVVLGLGTNQGDRFAALQSAIALLSESLSEIKTSPVYRSKALLLEGSPKEWNVDFLNMALCAKTTLSPEALLQVCKAVEAKLGRGTAYEKWSPRVMDVDILALGTDAYHSENLDIPHRDLLLRPFALLPFADLWPEWVSPSGLHPCIGEMAVKTPRQDIVRIGMFA